MENGEIEKLIRKQNIYIFSTENQELEGLIYGHSDYLGEKIFVSKKQADNSVVIEQELMHNIFRLTELMTNPKVNTAKMISADRNKNLRTRD